MNNNKTIICRNVLKNSKGCPHGNKCAFAHTLDEQHVSSLRQLAYDIITGKNFSNIKLNIDNDLYSTFLKLTRVCKNCIENNCSGGYNCKYGAIDSKYQICYDDLVNNLCNLENCTKVHLTQRGITKKIETLQDDSDTETEDDIKKIIAYLNDDHTTNNYDASIFDDSNSNDLLSLVENNDNK